MAISSLATVAGTGPASIVSRLVGASPHDAAGGNGGGSRGLEHGETPGRTAAAGEQEAVVAADPFVGT